MSTVVIPLTFISAKTVLRSYYQFHQCHQSSFPPYPLPRPFPSPVDPGFIITSEPGLTICKAPLTIIRSTFPADLKISVLFNKTFRPQDPIVPAPSKITGNERKETYSWNISAHTDGTITTTLPSGLKKRVNMIWWEATRNEAPRHLDPEQSVCVKKEEVKSFLEKTLKKIGVHEKELAGFVHYWDEILYKDCDPNSPYILVKLVDPSKLSSYIPEMQVSGKDAQAFDLKRFYFLFEPTKTPSGMDAKTYLEKLPEQSLSDNQVIDLGGEVSEFSSRSTKWEGLEAFTQEFIKKYIYA